MSDFRYALRTLLKAPAFTIVVILTLALGIGANTAIFSLTDQVLLRMLPVRSPEQLVVLDGPGAFRGRTFNNGTFSFPMYRDIRDQNTVFDGVIARFPAPLTRERRARVGQLFRRARRARAHRPHLHPGRRSDAGRPSDCRAQP
jgi:hypothetical protein